MRHSRQRAGHAIASAFDIFRPLDDEQAKRRFATNQALLRRVNEAMRPGRAVEALVFRCECGQLGCNQLIELTRAEYDAVRSHARRFAIAGGHDIDEIETTIERHARYAVVEAYDPVATAVAEQTNPRHRA